MPELLSSNLIILPFVFCRDAFFCHIKNEWTLLFQAPPCIILSSLPVSHCVSHSNSCSKGLSSQRKTITPHNNFTNTVSVTPDLAKWTKQIKPWWS